MRVAAGNAGGIIEDEKSFLQIIFHPQTPLV
ncbi:MAG: hypothetical protein ACJAYJ_002013 [Saprospiraceae bacterium]